MKKNKAQEFELITRVKEGHTSEFKLLIDKYKDVSFSLACSILKNEQDAEDALQESFIKAFKGLKKFNFKSSFSTWMYKIVVNTCKTKFNKQKRKNEFIGSNFYSKIEIEEHITPFKKINLKERKEIVNKILETMKEDESLLLRLFYLAELSIEEIKEITAFKDSKIKVTLHRGRKSFLQCFKKKYGHEII